MRSLRGCLIILFVGWITYVLAHYHNAPRPELVWYRHHCFSVTWKNHKAAAVHHPKCPCAKEAEAFGVWLAESVNDWISP